MALAQAHPVTGNLLPGLLPSRGINARDALLQMGQEDAVVMVNFLSDDAGLVLRGGYQEFATGLPGGLAVPTLMSYYPANAAVAAPSRTRTAAGVMTGGTPMLMPRAAVSVTGQLLACTNSNVYDVSAGGEGPWVGTEMLAAAAPSDYWTWLNFQNAAGDFLLATNHLGGYYVYTGTGTFIKVPPGAAPAVGAISGVSPDDLVFLMVWKRRVWLIEKNSTKAWYLPVEQTTGDAKMFDFGPQFRHGGRLEMLVSWTLDGGEGIDDHLVAISSQGDVVIFKGYDPDNAADDPNAFQLHGIWYVGALPLGRRSATTYGGDVYILSVYGITQLSKLIGSAATAAALVEDASSRVDPALSKLMAAEPNAVGWSIQFLPSEQMMVVSIPQQLASEGVTQYVMKIRRSAWSRMVDLPMASLVNHDTLAFGGGSLSSRVFGGGKVYLLFKNALDNVKLALGQSGSLIRGRVVPAFNSFGAPGAWKIFPMVRPIIRSPMTPAIKLQVLTDFTESTLYSTPSLPPLVPSLWNVDLWNVGKWSGYLTPMHKWLGTTGCGFAATVQLDITGLGGMTLMAIDWWVVPGGPL